MDKAGTKASSGAGGAKAAATSQKQLGAPGGAPPASGVPVAPSQAALQAVGGGAAPAARPRGRRGSPSDGALRALLSRMRCPPAPLHSHAIEHRHTRCNTCTLPQARTPATAATAVMMPAPMAATKAAAAILKRPSGRWLSASRRCGLSMPRARRPLRRQSSLQTRWVLVCCGREGICLLCQHLLCAAASCCERSACSGRPPTNRLQPLSPGQAA